MSITGVVLRCLYSLLEKWRNGDLALAVNYRPNEFLVKDKTTFTKGPCVSNLCLVNNGCLKSSARLLLILPVLFAPVSADENAWLYLSARNALNYTSLEATERNRKLPIFIHLFNCALLLFTTSNIFICAFEANRYRQSVVLVIPAYVLYLELLQRNCMQKETQSRQENKSEYLL